MRLSPVALALAVLAASPSALAAPPETPPPSPLEALRKPPGPTFDIVGALAFGDGLRLNNPYRLETQLADNAKSVSLTAPYVDLRAALTVGDAFGLRHGASLGATIAMSGVGQALLTPTYMATYRGAWHRYMAFGRLGPTIILGPDPNVGAELGAGGALFITAKTAVTAEIIGNLFYGAATTETGFPVYPVLSLQLGLLFDHEVLP